MSYSRHRYQLVHENVIKLLSMANEIESDYELWASWMRCVASSLYLEHKFKDSFDLVTGLSKKEVLVNLNGLSDVPVNSWKREDALKWCSDTYDVNHNLRFTLETLDSIEEVRLFLESLKSKNIGLHNLLKLKYKYKTQFETLN
jgi:hypothetical protein